MDSIKWVEHTADIQFIARGENIGELFERCCFAMFSSMTDVEKLSGEVIEKFIVKGEDFESLLYELLDYLIYVRDDRQLFLKSVVIESIAKKKGLLEVVGNVYGDKAADHTDLRYLDIKSVTYNMMRVEKKNDGRKVYWEAEVVLDI